MHYRDTPESIPQMQLCGTKYRTLF